MYNGIITYLESLAIIHMSNRKPTNQTEWGAAHIHRYINDCMVTGDVS